MGTLWHYAQDGRSLGPVPEEQLRAMLASGALSPSDLAWREGMAAWTRIQELPELQAVPPVPAPPQPNLYAAPQADLEPAPGFAPQALDAVSAEAVELLRRTKPWVRLFSVLGVLGIVMMALGAVAMILVSFGPFHTLPAAARLGVGALYFALAFVYVPPVVFLHRYASRIRDLVDEPTSRNLEEALRSQKSFWKYLGVLTVVAIGVYLLVLAGALAMGLLMGLGRR